jgi:uncharacterized protein YndB with AHSA1/START domain
MTTATTIEHQVVINAPAQLVWQVLTTLERYGDWNRYATEAHGTLKAGGEVEIVARLGNGTQRVNNRVLEIIPEQTLCWVSMNWYQALVRGTRCRYLEPQTDGTTHFRERETMQGPFARIVVGLMRRQLAAGLQAECDSLKAEAERLTH